MTRAGQLNIIKSLLTALCSALFVCALIFVCDIKASAASISGCTIQNISDKTYTGSQIKPVPYVKYNGRVLKKDTDYTLSYKSNTNAGTAYVVVTGKGKYSGTAKKAFKIKPQLIYKSTFYKISDKYFTGTAIKPVPQIKYNGRSLSNGKDFTLSYSANTSIGTAKVKITGKGNFNGSCSVSFKIKVRPLASSAVSVISPTYTGAALKPAVSIKCGSFAFVNGKDYTLTYKNNVSAGTGTIIIKGKNRLSGQKTVTFKIKPRSIAGASVSSISAASYTGKAVSPSVKVVLGGKTLTKNTHYTVAYKNNVQAGTASIIITGKGNYGGTAVKTFKINPVSLNTATVSAIGTQYFSGAGIKPVPAVKIGTKTLKNGTDFTLSYSANLNIGTAQAVIKGKGNYSGTVIKKFSIKARPLQNTQISVPSVTYSGSALKPAVTVKAGSFAFVNGTDYTVSYSNNIKPGTGTVTVTGKNRLSGSITKTFTVNKRSVSGAVISGIPASAVFSGNAVKPAFTVTVGGKKLAAGTDYTVTYADNINAGAASVTITGKGNYSGSIKKTFMITKAPIEAVDFKISGQYAPGGTIHDIAASYNGYILKQSDFFADIPQIAGEHIVSITGAGNFSGACIIDVTVAPTEISDTSELTVTPIISESGEGHSVLVKYRGYKLVNGTDYTAEITENGVDIIVVINGINNYHGTVTAVFRADIADVLDDITADEILPPTYTGSAQRPPVVLRLGDIVLIENSDYTAEYVNNVNAGTAAVNIVGINNYTGLKRSISFEILPAAITDCKAVCDTQNFSGSALKPVPDVMFGQYSLVNGTDFVITGYSSNTGVGTGIIHISGRGNFTGDAQVSFLIKSFSAMEAKIRQRLDEMMEGKWDRKINDYMHSYKLGNYYNTLLTAPCSCHDFCDTGLEDGCTCLIGRSIVLNNSGIQCAGFTIEVFEYLFGGTNGAGENTLRIFDRRSNTWTVDAIRQWMSSFRAGDYLAYDNIAYGYPHYVTIYSVDSDGIWVYEANYGGRCKINFRKMTYEEIYSQLDGLWHRTPDNYELTTSY